MSSSTLSSFKLLLCSSLGISVLFGYYPTFAQVNSDIVVPTTSAPGNTNQNVNRTTNQTNQTDSNVTRTRVSNISTGNSSSTTTTRTNTSSSNTNPVSSDNRFGCFFYNNQYTVMYQPESQPGKYFAWATPRNLGGGWSAQRRCQTIAQRLERYRPDGLLELRDSTLNGYNTVCVNTENNSDCRLILTVPPGQDPVITRNQIFNNLITADSGQETIGVNTYTNTGNEIGNILNSTGIFGRRSRRAPSRAVSKNAINLKSFLDRSDYGNGRALRGGVKIPNKSNPTSSGLQLNPNKFR
ncbi:MAG: hypothetical protein HRU34_02510 [Richelia sp.]|nr:hypothetical protein [Richelia sp.]